MEVVEMESGELETDLATTSKQVQNHRVAGSRFTDQHHSSVLFNNFQSKGFPFTASLSSSSVSETFPIQKDSVGITCNLIFNKKYEKASNKNSEPRISAHHGCQAFRTGPIRCGLSSLPYSLSGKEFQSHVHLGRLLGRGSSSAVYLSKWQGKQVMQALVLPSCR